MPVQSQAQTREHQLRAVDQSSMLQNQIMMSSSRISPLERVEFENSLKEFYEKNGFQLLTTIIDLPIPIENTSFLLWDLHREVFDLGTFTVVSLLFIFDCWSQSSM